MKNNFSIFQLSKQVNSFINTVGVGKDTKENDSEEHEYDKNDQVITKAESEVRIFILLSIFAFVLNSLFLMCIYHMLIITREPKLKEYPDPAVVQKLPYLQVQFNNGSSEIVSFKNASSVYSSFSFSKQDFYFHYYYNQQNSFIHGKYGPPDNRTCSTDFFAFAKNATITSKIHHFCFHSRLDPKALKLRKEKKHFYRYNIIDKFDKSKGFAPTHNLTIVQIGSYLWLLGGGYSGYDCVNLPEPGPCYGSIDYCAAKNPEMLDYYPILCDCVLEEDTELWSMEKSQFVSSSLRLPFGFGMISCCAIGLNRNIGLLIGGHYVKTDKMYDYPLNYPINDQVIEFDISTGKYTMLRNVPLAEYMKWPPGDIKYYCEISYLKNTSRFIFVMAQKYTKNNRIMSQMFIYHPDTGNWIKQSVQAETNTIYNKHRNVLFKYLGGLYSYGKGGLHVYSPYNHTWQKSDVRLDYEFNNIYSINTLYL